MIKKTITIGIPNGMAARPVALLVQVASQYNSNIYVESGTKKINAKSIMGLMALSLPAGEDVVVAAEGNDEVEAIKDIEKYLSSSSVNA